MWIVFGYAGAVRDFITLLLLCTLLTVAADAAYLRGKYFGAYYPDRLIAQLQKR
jgi:hypothetical protein